MKTSQITVADYGVGNLFSICRAVESTGAIANLTGDPRMVRSADRIILPGVGAFGNGMAALVASGLDDAIKDAALAGTPILGICLGMQMLLDASEEYGEHQGLGLIAGRVTPVPRRRSDGTLQKIPHIGWSELREPFSGRWSKTILSEFMPGTAAYFVHSFAATPEDESDVLAVSDYGGNAIAAAVQHENIIGCQFHPERSGSAGLGIIRRFVSS